MNHERYNSPTARSAGLRREPDRLSATSWCRFSCGDIVREIDGRHLGRIEAIFGYTARVRWCGSTPRMFSDLRLDEIERVP